MSTKKILSGFAAFVLAILAASGIYKPEPKPQPTPVPTASATPEPTVAPTALPTPTAAPTPPPDPCADFEETNAPWVDKPTTPSMFREHVRRWQAQAANNGFVVGDYVTGEEVYMAEIVRLARVEGFKVTNCGVRDEIWVAGPGFSEHFDLVTADLLVWNHYAARAEPEKWKERTP